ncbi:MAG: restriction endonuclease subunit S [Alphaproteobacteria bacterium]|nr:restriction endonuclease subunit S [Alphaproteobacteria bacterium]MBU0794805.1 restriction endonuclease subunit S [Alphaproteobacteria bacterium]MBU0876190.1 restriction endonuclease subunit S [Alphaproteobacteria bacterium]MBU1768711.1 restriction endonuclease subunit S [Alphaproteobacteria bacterium]
MSFPAYPDYKDSGVAWLGDVPSHWTIGRIKDLFEIRKRIAGELGYDVLSITQSGIRVKDVESNDGQQAMDYSKYQLVYPGDFAMNHMDLLTGWIDIAAQNGVTSPDYRVFAARNPATINDRFYLSVFQMAYTARQFYPFGQGSSQLGRWRLPTDAFYAFPIPVPSVAEQSAIHSFLDRETAKIDALVAEQERLITLLREKRHAVISHAVTKGLNPGAPMKDSGIEWLGEIPAHWEVPPVGSLLMESPCYGVLVPDGDPEGVPMLRITDMQDGSARRDALVTISPALSAQYSRTIVSEGDLLLSVVGTIGESLIVDSQLAGVNLSRAVARLQPNGNASAQFMRWIFRSTILSHFVDMTCVGTAQKVLNMGALASMRVPLPSKQEQDEIVEHLGRAIDILENLIATAISTISLLQERRTVLISAAITGKIDVRALASQSNVVPIDSARPSILPPLRAVVGAYAIRELGPMGRMAVMKAGYLAEGHTGFSDLNGRYERFAAGPYDSSLIAAMERGAEEICSIVINEPQDEGKPVTYDIPKGCQPPPDALSALVGEDRAQRFLALLSLLKGIGRDGVEAAATLYAVWNDLLAAGKAADANAICNGVLNDWHPEKAKKFKRADLDHWLDWMRRNRLVPDGSAPRTDNQGSLFA